MKKLLLILCLVFLANLAFGQNKQNPETPSPIIFIYDASGSMWGQMEGKTKMEIASTVLSTSINDFAENQQIGLIAYGHRKKGDCRDVETLLPMSNTSKSKVATAVKNIKPLGKTPLAYTAETVIGQLRTSKQKATIVLITDGIESCDGDICKVVSAAKKEGIDFKLHIVGFGLKKGETEQLKCAAKAGDGNYYDAADASGLGDAMTLVASETVDKPDGNHGVYATMNGEAIDAYVKAYKAGTDNEAGYKRTYRDTAFVFLPQETYDLVVRPLENSKVKPITIKNVQTSDDKLTYTIVSFDGGTLAVTTTNNGEGWDSTLKIKDADGKVVNGARTYGKTKEIELNAGTYSIDIQALVMKGLNTTTTIKDQVIVGGQTTNVSFDFETGQASIAGTYNGEQYDVGVKIKDAATGEIVYGGRTYKKFRDVILNPGTYNVTLVEVGVYNSSAKSAQFTMEVKKGETVTVSKEIK
ncbi:VWA domain-containing protein [Rasiella rasia]|uniref:VWA domain-containing protein n=1 Tax=Rasiella rasia TaxID=2744027 RepID=A0A6G6GJX2_9FLAO|nr:VWA domain-containing protein [Rasiella rasia]QIE58875.1 VWA domain-containing protein [Rasiella rasia]